MLGKENKSAFFFLNSKSLFGEWFLLITKNTINLSGDYQSRSELYLHPLCSIKRVFSLNGNQAQITFKTANLLAVSVQHKEERCSHDAESSNLIIFSVITSNFRPFLIPLGSHPAADFPPPPQLTGPIRRYVLHNPPLYNLLFSDSICIVVASTQAINIWYIPREQECSQAKDFFSSVDFKLIYFTKQKTEKIPPGEKSAEFGLYGKTQLKGKVILFVEMVPLTHPNTEDTCKCVNTCANAQTHLES